MATWKQLGEVPDSDEEDLLDSDDSQPQEVVLPEPPDFSQEWNEPQGGNEPANNASIWDIPPSSPNVEESDPRSLNIGPKDAATPGTQSAKGTSPKHLEEVTRPLSFRPTDEGSDLPSVSLSYPPPQKPTLEAATTTGASHEPCPPLEYVAGSTDSPSNLAGKANAGNIGEGSAGLRQEDELHRNKSPHKGQSQDRGQSSESAAEDGVLNRREDAPTRAVHREEADPSNHEEAGTGTHGPTGRTFRPRKPIQEHPYLVESARYSTFMKSHGVRPIRVVMEEEAARTRKRHEQDFQEKDYEEDSQKTVTSDLRHDTEESQEINEKYEFDLDELMLSPPVRRPRPPDKPKPNDARQSARISHENNGNDDDDDELPSLQEIFERRGTGRARRLGKRPGSPKDSPRPKALRKSEPRRLTAPPSPQMPVSGVLRMMASPPQTSSPCLPLSPAGCHRATGAVANITPGPSSLTASREGSALREERHRVHVDLTVAHDVASRAVGKDAYSIDELRSDVSSGSSSENEEDFVQEAARRMRGVLPASWLRLDQLGQGRVQKSRPRRGGEPSPERLARKGVAQRRQVSSRSNNDVHFITNDESDDDDTTSLSNEIPRMREIPAITLYDDDDADSVVEEDHIDRMQVGKKRNGSGLEGEQRPAKRQKGQRMFVGQTGRKRRQQKITRLFDSPENASSLSSRRRKGPEDDSRSRNRYPHHRTVPRHATPPRLSILDVIEPSDPDFVRIAARSVKRRGDKGKSSPSSKQISLGSRRDNVDALSVLRDWKRGRIRPRTNVTGLPISRPLRSIHGNAVAKSTYPGRRSNARQAASGATIADFFAPGPIKVPSTRPAEVVQSGQGAVLTAVSRKQRPRLGHGISPVTTSRPAQLETTDAGDRDQHAFSSRKKWLDALYRKSKRSMPSSVTTGLDRVLGSRPGVPSPAIHPTQAADRTAESGPTIRPGGRTGGRTRERKRARPRFVDISAPQYAHANDPLPRELSVVEEAVVGAVTAPDPRKDKLLGLGSFGAHYTHHFEIFPLEDGVFFHDSTVIGSGRLTKAMNDKHLDGLRHSRAHCSLVVDGKTLRWGVWCAQTSSDMGVLFDWILEQLQSEDAEDAADSTDSSRAVQSMDFVLKYLQDHLHLEDSESERHFVDRMLEVTASFTERLDVMMKSAGVSLRLVTEILTRCVMIAFQTLRVCSRLGLATESLQLEEVLQKAAKLLARGLLSGDLRDIRELYDDLQRPYIRDLGIRRERYSATAWVVLMRCLRKAEMRRAGFWEVVSPMILGDGVGSMVHVQQLERCWHSIFTLLPLTEFDEGGLAVAGSRHSSPLEGWLLPQKLLGRVFDLYKANPRQSPSFNDYCRSMVSRCHHLVRHWGWSNCQSMVGTIFDFFASQSLCHLRNEQVYKSPQFLEQLADAPSLAVEPEDGCFHIFLKLLALTIKRQRKMGQTKAIRNLVARILPNHDRQYLKESELHENDLASLRNHHDLLCTLFWAAPPDLRPAAQSIEKLVLAGTSHKEACLVNLRAWNQLARFVVSSGEDVAVYRPFAEWHKKVFQQLLDQHMSAESDIQRQLRSMVRDGSDLVDGEMIRRVVSMNKGVVADVLHFSLKASLDVLKHTVTLGAASVVLCTYQISHIITRCSPLGPEFDWGTVQVAVDTVDLYLSRVDKAQKDSAASDQGDDALMFLERQLSADLFFLARNVVSMALEKKARMMKDDKQLCIERVVILAARLASRLILARSSRLSQFFGSGRKAVFERLQANLSLQSRKYLCLFVAVLIEQGVTDFEEMGTSSLELFLCAVTKPYVALAYENRLADAMKRRKDAYLQDAVVVAEMDPDYASNVALFEHTMSAMRKSLRLSSTSQRQQQQGEYKKALGAVMDQVKVDLRSIADESSQHRSYIEFVQRIISLIKIHDLCPVDNFFHQISREYSPSAQDANLQVATMLSYGIKLEDGNPSASWGLFYCLYPRFKLAMANNRLGEEMAVVQEGMANHQIFSFMLGRMMPAAMKAATRAPEAFILLQVYVGALERLLDEDCVHREMGEESMVEILTLLTVALASLERLRALGAACLRTEHLRTLVTMSRLLNLFTPSITAYLYTDPTSTTSRMLSRAVDEMTDFSRAAAQHLSAVLDSSTRSVRVDPDLLFEGIVFGMADAGLEGLEHINGFADNMVSDMQKSWVRDGDTISVQGPARAPASSTQTGAGTKVPATDVTALARDLYEQVCRWNAGNHVPAQVGPEAEFASRSIRTDVSLHCWLRRQPDCIYPL